MVQKDTTSKVWKEYLGCELPSVALMQQGKICDLACAAPAAPGTLLAIGSCSLLAPCRQRWAVS